MADGGTPGLGNGKLVIDERAAKGFCGGVADGGLETEGGGEVCDKADVPNGPPGVGEVLGVMPLGTPRLIVGGTGLEESETRGWSEAPQRALSDPWDRWETAASHCGPDRLARRPISARCLADCPAADSASSKRTRRRQLPIRQEYRQTS